MGRGTHRGIPQIFRTIPSRGISRRVHFAISILGRARAHCARGCTCWGSGRRRVCLPAASSLTMTAPPTSRRSIVACCCRLYRWLRSRPLLSRGGRHQGPDGNLPGQGASTFDDARRAPFDDAAGSAHRDVIDSVFASGITKECTERHPLSRTRHNPGAGGLVPQPGLCLSDRRGASLFRCRRSSCRGCSPRSWGCRCHQGW